MLQGTISSNDRQFGNKYYKQVTGPCMRTSFCSLSFVAGDS